MAPSALLTIFWVTTRTSSSRNGRTDDAASASAMIAGRSSPGVTSAMPGMATTSTRSATRRLRVQALGEHQVVGRIEVELEWTGELDDRAPLRPRPPRRAHRGCRHRTGSR